MKTKTQQRKEREREARRDSILDAAGEVFARKGFHEATLDEIADAAELAKGTLYNYYQDKQDIFVSLARRSMESFQQDLERIQRSTTQLADYVYQTVDLLVGTMLEHGYLLRAMYQSGPELTTRVRSDVLDDCHGEQDIVERSIAESLLRFTELPDHSVAYRNAGAAIILGTARHMALFGLHEERPEPPEETKRLISSMLVRALIAEHV